MIPIHYTGNTAGKMESDNNGLMCFTEVILHPIIRFENSFDEALALDLHNKANKKCFIANSVIIPVKHEVKFL